MNKQTLAFGIVLALGISGCAGLGLQHSSSLSAELGKEQGLDRLWSSTERVPAPTVEVPLYADQVLGDLWNPSEGAPTAGEETGGYGTRALGSLWLSATAPSRILAQ